jgi:hypothetical protein
MIYRAVEFTQSSLLQRGNSEIMPG